MHRLAYEDDKRWARILAQLEVTRIAAVQAPPRIEYQSLLPLRNDQGTSARPRQLAPGHFFDHHHAGAAGADRATS